MPKDSYGKQNLKSNNVGIIIPPGRDNNPSGIIFYKVKHGTIPKSLNILTPSSASAFSENRRNFWHTAAPFPRLSSSEKEDDDDGDGDGDGEQG